MWPFCSGMAQSLDIPLPEVTAENLKRAWTRFELVAKAKEWEKAKQLTVLPTLLRGKLVDKYVDFDDETKSDIGKLKSALEKASGRTEDPLAAARAFVARDQGPSESIDEFSSALKKIFKQGYPSEATTSAVLLQRFLTGRPSISQQILLRKKPEDLAEAITIAMEVEYALSFDGGRKKEPSEVNLVQRPTQTHEQPHHAADQLSKLQSSLDEMTKRMEALEAALTAQRQAQLFAGATAGNKRTAAGNRDRDRRTCFLCGQEGHIKRSCPLNYPGPARTAGGWPGPY